MAMNGSHRWVDNSVNNERYFSENYCKILFEHNSSYLVSHSAIYQLVKAVIGIRSIPFRFRDLPTPQFKLDFSQLSAND